MKEEKITYSYMPDWFSLTLMGLVGIVVVVTLTVTYWRLEKYGQLF